MATKAGRLKLTSSKCLFIFNMYHFLLLYLSGKYRSQIVSMCVLIFYNPIECSEFLKFKCKIVISFPVMNFGSFFECVELCCELKMPDMILIRVHMSPLKFSALI